MNGRERWREQLHAYHDGELSWLRRWQVEHRLARDPESRAQLETLGEMRTILRETVDGSEPGPGLWDAIRAELPLTRGPAPAAPARRWLGIGVPQWAGASLAAAGLALALLLSGGPADVVPASSVRWLHSPDHPTMVLQDDAEATIIWMFEPEERSERRSHRVLG